MSRARQRYEGPDPEWNISGAAGLKLYKVFESKNGGGTDSLVIPAMDEQKKRELGILNGQKFVRYIVAHDWAEAMTKHHERMGWEPYVPFELE